MKRKSKGIALPIETIVIVAIVVLVLTVLVIFFVGGSGRQISAISSSEALARGCTTFVLPPYSCDVPRLPEVRIAGYEGGLTAACAANGYTDNAQCAQIACKCT